MRSDQRAKPPIVDADFEVITGPRSETWGERQSREFGELNWFGKLAFWAIFIPTMGIVGWLAKTVVGWITAALGWS